MPLRKYLKSIDLPNLSLCRSMQISFSPVAPGYLAAGFERTRGQYGLHVWDIERTAKALAGPQLDLDDPVANAYKPPNLLVPDDNADYTISGSSRLSQTRTVATSNVASSSDGAGTIRRYALNETVTSVAYMPDHAHVLAVGTGAHLLRLYDIRKPRDNRETSSDIETTAVHGICFDPFDSTRMASFGDDGIVRFWDARLPKVVLSLNASLSEDGNTTKKPAAISHIAFSSIRRGLFGTLTEDATHMKFWTLMGGYPRTEADEKAATRNPPKALAVDENAEDYMNAKAAPESAEPSIPLVVGRMRPGESTCFTVNCTTRLCH